MAHTLATIDYTRQPCLRVFPDDNRLKNALIHDVQHHCLADRQVDALIVKRVRFVGNQMQVFRFERQNVRFAAGAVYKL